MATFTDMLLCQPTAPLEASVLLHRAGARASLDAVAQLAQSIEAGHPLRAQVAADTRLKVRAAWVRNESLTPQELAAALTGETRAGVWTQATTRDLPWELWDLAAPVLQARPTLARRAIFNFTLSPAAMFAAVRGLGDGLNSTEALHLRDLTPQQIDTILKESPNLAAQVLGPLVTLPALSRSTRQELARRLPGHRDATGRAATCPDDDELADVVRGLEDPDRLREIAEQAAPSGHLAYALATNRHTPADVVAAMAALPARGDRWGTSMVIEVLEAHRHHDDGSVTLALMKHLSSHHTRVIARQRAGLLTISPHADPAALDGHLHAVLAWCELQEADIAQPVIAALPWAALRDALGNRQATWSPAQLTLALIARTCTTSAALEVFESVEEHFTGSLRELLDTVDYVLAASPVGD